jgi:ATP-dependent RNA helicase DeaD
MDMMERKILNLSHLRFAVLDEVDRMLDIGFRDDIRFILSKITQPHQTVLVSATVDEEIRRLAKSYMKNPQELNVSRDHITVDEIDQFYCSVEPEHKFSLLMKLLEQENPPLMIVFTNTKHGARKLAKKLHAAGINATEIHGDLEQKKRNRVMDSFRKHKIRLLVATDLASRGIDVSAISHIVNYDIPKDTQAYVHRIGRTARMGARGRAFTFVCRDEGKQLTEVEILINRQIEMYRFDGFDPRPRQLAKPDGPAAPSVAASPAAAVQTAISKPKVTLGAKFKPKRRWRP